MTGKVDFIEAPSNIVEAVSNGLIDENTYYNCVISEDVVSDNEMLIQQLTQAQWDDPLSYPVEADIKRAISHIPEFRVKLSSYPAAIACYGYVEVTREKSTTVELDSSFKETDVKIGDMDLQMSLTDYRDILSSYSSISNKPTTYPARILSVKNMKEPPYCQHCGGTGKVACPSCHGIGNGECPDCKGTGCFFDCKAGKQGFLHSRFGKIYKLYYGDSCPTCAGNGSFECKECNETGEIDCFYCNGNGYENGATRAQKVTRLKETYFPYMNGELFLPNDTSMDFDVTMVKKQLCKMPPTVFRKPHKTATHHQSGSNSPEGMVMDLLESIINDEALIGVNFIAYTLPQVRVATFSYDGKEYSILVIGERAFARELPTMTFMEGLLKSYKKKIQ